MPEITNTIVDSTGSPVIGAEIRITLIGLNRWSADGQTETLAEWSGVTDATGNYLVDLPSQSLYEGSTYYLVREPGARHSITVPDPSGPHQVRDLLTTPVAESAVTALSLDGLSNVSTSGAQGGQVLGYDGASWSPVIVTGEGGTADHGLLSGLADDDHGQYHTDARGDARYVQLGDGSYATPADVTSAITTHEVAGDPHPGYLTSAEGNAAYAATGHTHDSRYYTESETDTALSGKSDTAHDHDGSYSATGHNHDSDYADVGHTHPGTTVTASPEGSPPSSPATGDVWVVT